ncbi:MAG: spore germination protein, partial [bacterium]
MIKEILGNSSDLVIRQIRVSGKTLAIAYIEDLADKKLVKVVLESLLLKRPLVEQAGLNLDANMERWREMGVPLGEVTAVQNMGEAITGLLNGNTCLMGDGWPQVLLVDTKGWEKRAISEPQTSIVVRGSREGFVENIRTNMALVRRRLRHPNLRVESLVVGDVTNTQISIMYIDGIVNNKLVAEVRERIRRIKIDGVLEGHYLEAMIEDNPFSPFPQVWSTERPDTVVADLLEGRVAILTDGTPFALTVPLGFATLLQSPEDYYQRWSLSLFLRPFRYLGLGISAFLHALYVAITTYHQEMLPTSLLVSILMQRERVPYPAVVEALVMQITFEILLEAGARLPRALGQAIGIVGALVIGDAAVRAGLVSPAMVIVVSATAIASFTFPSFDLTNTVRLLRVPLILMGAVLGLFGLFSGLI